MDGISARRDELQQVVFLSAPFMHLEVPLMPGGIITAIFVENPQCGSLADA